MPLRAACGPSERSGWRCRHRTYEREPSQGDGVVWGRECGERRQRVPCEELAPDAEEPTLRAQLSEPLLEQPTLVGRAHLLLPDEVHPSSQNTNQCFSRPEVWVIQHSAGWRHAIPAGFVWYSVCNSISGRIFTPNFFIMDEAVRPELL